MFTIVFHIRLVSLLSVSELWLDWSTVLSHIHYSTLSALFTTFSSKTFFTALAPSIILWNTLGGDVKYVIKTLPDVNRTQVIVFLSCQHFSCAFIKTKKKHRPHKLANHWSLKKYQNYALLRFEYENKFLNVWYMSTSREVSHIVTHLSPMLWLWSF